MNETSTLELFIPCLADQVYPEIGFAMVRVLEHLGYRLHYNTEQTCCGQPAFNGGQWEQARSVAREFVRCFAGDDGRIVSPSGSCAAMIRNFYPQLFAGEADEAAALALGPRVIEFSQLLVADGCLERIDGEFRGRVGFHNSCHSYRELGITDEPLRVMDRIRGFTWAQPEGEPVCCGFGGLFMVKFAPISGAMAGVRLAMFTDLGADTIVSNDPGCIMNLRQEAAARGLALRILHLAEFLDEAMGLSPEGAA